MAEAFTHQVRRAFESAGRLLRPGALVDASFWPNAQTLVEQLYITPLAVLPEALAAHRIRRGEELLGALGSEEEALRAAVPRLEVEEVALAERLAAIDALIATRATVAEELSAKKREREAALHAVEILLPRRRTEVARIVEEARAVLDMLAPAEEHAAVEA